MDFGSSRLSLYLERNQRARQINKLHASVTRDDIIATRQAVTVQQAADYLGVSHKTVRRMIASGALNAYRVGGPSRGPIRLLAFDVEAAKVPVRAS